MIFSTEILCIGLQKAAGLDPRCEQHQIKKSFTYKYHGLRIQ